MRLFFALLISFVFISCGSAKFEKVSMHRDVAVLAHDSLQGRMTGTEYEKKAASYIAHRFTNLNLKPLGTDGYFQDFHFKASKNPHQEAVFSEYKTDESVTGTNVIGFLDNKAQNTVIIGAHYDHLGLGGQGSLYRGEPAIHNGADDNASGVAVLLHLAAELQAKNAPRNNNYLFMAFSGEELGLLGSNFFSKNPTINLDKVPYMLNMDMVGRLNEERALAVYGIGTSPVLPDIIRENAGSLKIIENESGVGPSDHTSFYLVNIPVLHFFTGQHEDYHRPSDDTEKINFKGMELISDYIYSIINDLDNQGKLTFTKTKNESEKAPDFKVTLGVVPDYLFDGEGMRLDGVSEDKPAQKAGMKKGDIVKKMGKFVISDMMSYMQSLGEFKPGQTIIVTIDRDGEYMELEVTF